MIQNDNHVYYPIGEFSKICSVTAKQLRYYDENGILSPAYIDEENQYRYYEASQIQEVLLLKELKSLNISLDDIATVLRNRDAGFLNEKLHDAISVAQNDVKEALFRYNRAVDIMTRANKAMEQVLLVDRVKDVEPLIQKVEIPERTVIFTRYESRWNVNYLFTDRRAEIYRMLDDYHLSPFGAISAVFHGGYRRQFSDKPEDFCGDLELFMGVENVKSCPNYRVIKKIKALSAIHLGNYPSLIYTYDAIERYAREHNIKLSEDSIEEYVFGTPMTKNSDQYLTRVYIPIVGE